MNPDQLKQEILSKVEEYYRLVHKGSSSFIAGTTKIGYAGRVYDEREMVKNIENRKNRKSQEEKGLPAKNSWNPSGTNTGKLLLLL